tara:strand:+ start:6 stop:1103 length:1098 start_codon:yes stop_codon:yes gene_type:complete
MKMRRFNFNYKTFILGFLALPLVFLFVTSCFEITGNDQPNSVAAGSTQTFTLDVKLDTEGENEPNNRRLYFGICAPKNWEVGKNASVSFDSPIDGDKPGKGTMTLDPGDLSKGFMKGRGTDGEPVTGKTYAEVAEEILGFNENYGLMEWTMFYSEQVKANPHPGADGTISIQLKIGDGATAAKLGYWVGHHNKGFSNEEHKVGTGTPGGTFRHYDHEWKKITVTGASAEATDLTGPKPVPPSSITAGESGFTYDDIITIDFNASQGLGSSKTALFNAGKVYMVATAMLGDGTPITIGGAAENSSKNEMTMGGADAWSKTIWPPGYFGVTDQIITQLHVNFQNQDGSIIVNDPATGSDIVFEEKCE